nr:uncharacterized protein LOC111756767 [Cavia porcellus]
MVFGLSQGNDSQRRSAPAPQPLQKEETNSAWQAKPAPGNQKGEKKVEAGHRVEGTAWGSQGHGAEQRHLGSLGKEKKLQAGDSSAQSPWRNEGHREPAAGTEINKTETEKRKTPIARIARSALLSSLRLEVELSEVKVHLLSSGYEGGCVRTSLPTTEVSPSFLFLQKEKKTSKEALDSKLPAACLGLGRAGRPRWAWGRRWGQAEGGGREGRVGGDLGVNCCCCLGLSPPFGEVFVSIKNREGQLRADAARRARSLPTAPAPSPRPVACQAASVSSGRPSLRLDSLGEAIRSGSSPRLAVHRGSSHNSRLSGGAAPHRSAHDPAACVQTQALDFLPFFLLPLFS